MDCVPHVSITVDGDEIEQGAGEILQVLRPQWKKCDIKFKLLTDGLTNKLVGCKLKDASDEDTVLIRVYGNKTDLLIDRKAESRNIILLNKVGLAPELYATFDNGLAYKFIPGSTLKPHTVTDPVIYRLVAKRMANLHRVQIPEETINRPSLWTKTQSFLDLVPEIFSDANKHKKFEETIMSKKRISEEVQYLKEVLGKLQSPVVFAHNDLLLGNVIYTEEKGTVNFIDFEYAAPNYQAFDIANHFAEFAGVDEVDYSKYPNKELQYDWLTTYLKEYNNRVPSISEVDRLYVQVNQFALMAHVFWGIWSLLQAEHSDIDFDFMDYGALRFNEYLKRKEEFLALNLPNDID
ncbi:ethanolamine kinase [Aethina tumida]|uniref:ethanolamine kinase n=1 Tax=Aethina tumida TaxID=116153 RepID=UPI00096AF5E9|nr:ethanolamine kinase [Aethina tumida]XP_019865532.1 ethanolamine kinase [Aethina tumida]XP_019865533.1 ethanolamine kinase [Aethina tumida]